MQLFLRGAFLSTRQFAPPLNLAARIEGEHGMNVEERKRENALRLVEDHIGRHLAESEKTGELQAAPSFGKPLDYGDGYSETPEDLRMGFKLLKDGGYVPPEVELMQEIEALRRTLETNPNAADASVNQKRLSEMRQRLAMQLEKLRGG
jgi:hypothetical protein